METKKSIMVFQDFVGFILDCAKVRYDEKSIYNDTAIDSFDGIYDACINANDYCFFDCPALFEDDIKFSREQRAFYRNTTNRKDYAYYRSYTNTMTHMYHMYKYFQEVEN